MLITFPSATLWAFNIFSMHISQHMISQSPDQASWKWVQRSYDYCEKRKRRTKLNTSLHLCSCWLAGRVHLFLVSVKKGQELVFQPQTQLPSQKTAAWREIKKTKKLFDSVQTTFLRGWIGKTSNLTQVFSPERNTDTFTFNTCAAICKHLHIIQTEQ